MNRSSTRGWGPGYAHADPRAFAVDGERASVRVPEAGQSRSAILTGVIAANARGSFGISFADAPTSGRGISAGLQLRRSGTSYYQSAVRLAPGGVAFLSVVRVNGSSRSQTVLREITLPFVVPAGSTVSFDFEAVGTRSVDLRARAWVDGTTRPEWQLDVDDSSSKRITATGKLGVWTYASRGSRASVIHVDNLDVVSLVDASAPSRVAPKQATPATAPITATPTATAPATQAPASPSSSAPDASGAGQQAEVAPTVPEPPATPSDEQQAEGSATSPQRSADADGDTSPAVASLTADPVIPDPSAPDTSPITSATPVPTPLATSVPTPLATSVSTPAASPSATPKPAATSSSTVTPTPIPSATPAPATSSAAEPVPPVAEVQPAASIAASRVTAGAAAVGTTRYPVPEGAIFVAPSGADTNKGTIGSPLRTVARAISVASSGSTIVLRAGTYHESITVPSTRSRLTIQAYPKETVWFDGSSVVSTWSGAGSAWVSSGWTAQFDSSPTFTFGAQDGTTASWTFVNPARPLAAHPDQVWVDGIAQVQVASAAAVVPGAFYVDYTAKKLYLGTDPRGKTVRASDIATAISLRGEGGVLRGVGVRRYAPSVPHMGAVTAEKRGITIENVVIADNATSGLFVKDSGSVVRSVTLERNGMMGASASVADALTITGVLSRNNNTEGFNNSPVSGGFKITRSRGVSVTNSVFLHNAGPGLWFDESVYDGTVTGNDIIDNAGHGLILEISAKFTVANNIVSGNRDNGMKINDTASVEVWNNTVVGNGRSINIVQDSRRASNLSTPGHDKRQPLPDPTMTWIVGPVTVSNNIVGETTGNCLLCVEDYSKQYTAEQMGVTARGNVYQRPTASAPSWLTVWSKGAGNPGVYTTLATFVAATGQEKASLDIVSSPVVGANDAATAAVTAQAGAVAQPLPDRIGALTGKPTGTRQLGAFFG